MQGNFQSSSCPSHEPQGAGVGLGDIRRPRFGAASAEAGAAAASGRSTAGGARGGGRLADTPHREPRDERRRTTPEQPVTQFAQAGFGGLVWWVCFVAEFQSVKLLESQRGPPPLQSMPHVAEHQTRGRVRRGLTLTGRACGEGLLVRKHSGKNWNRAGSSSHRFASLDRVALFMAQHIVCV